MRQGTAEGNLRPTVPHMPTAAARASCRPMQTMRRCNAARQLLTRSLIKVAHARTKTQAKAPALVALTPVAGDGREKLGRKPLSAAQVTACTSYVCTVRTCGLPRAKCRSLYGSESPETRQNTDLHSITYSIVASHRKADGKEGLSVCTASFKI